MIVGLDAATWDLVGPWIQQGLLPNLAKVTQLGVSGRLESVLPPITPPAWTAFTTGKNPGKHGIFHFVEPTPGSYAMRYVNASSRRAKTIFRQLSDAGFSVGAMNIPFTYPPEILSGFQISGMDTPSANSAFVYPQPLRAELESVVGRLDLDVRYLGFMSTDERRDQVLAEMERLDNQWTKIALHLLEKHPCDVMQFVFMSIDTVQHYFWQYMDPNHFLHDPPRAKKYGDAILKVYQRLDRSLGQMLEKIGDDTTVFVVSDHGGGPVSDRTVYLNRYLHRLGLLKYKAKKPSFENAVKAAIKPLYELIRSSLTSKQKSALASMFPALRERFETTYTSFADIDWTQTNAYCSEVLASPPSISINLKGEKPSGIVDPGEYEELRSLLIAKIKELKDPRTGESIIKRVLRREEIFHGPFVKEAPDLILDWWEASLFSTAPSFPEHSHEPPVVIRERKPSTESEWGGTHRLHGILIASGKHCRKNAKIEGARLIDVAPTILHLMGQSVPEDMDGKVLSDLLDPGYVASHPIRYEKSEQPGTESAAQGKYSAEETAQVEERLKALGYIE